MMGSLRGIPSRLRSRESRTGAPCRDGCDNAIRHIGAFYELA